MGNDVNIAGVGTVAPGTYDKVTVNGAGTISGDIACTALKINGTAQAMGIARADAVTVNGTATFRRSVQANEMTVNGDTSIAEGAGIGKLNVKGRMSVAGGLAAHTMDLRGQLDIGGGLDVAGRLYSEGTLTAGGALTAEDVEIRLFGRNRVAGITATTVVVGLPNRSWDLGAIFSVGGERRLYADTIEASSVKLENTTVRQILGGNVELGPGVAVESVIYSGEFVQGPDSVVGSAVKAEARAEA